MFHIYITKSSADSFYMDYWRYTYNKSTIIIDCSIFQRTSPLKVKIIYITYYIIFKPKRIVVDVYKLSIQDILQLSIHPKTHSLVHSNSSVVQGRDQAHRSNTFRDSPSYTFRHVHLLGIQHSLMGILSSV